MVQEKREIACQVYLSKSISLFFIVIAIRLSKIRISVEEKRSFSESFW